MTDELSQFYDLIEIDRLPSRVRRFVQQEPPNGLESTLCYYAHAYANGFEVLLAEAKKRWPRQDYLQIPVLYLARHSIELNLKAAIEQFRTNDPTPPQKMEHNLMALWRDLCDYGARWSGEPFDDEYTAHCEKLLVRFHEIDKDGQRLRYPFSKQNKLFDITRVSDFDEVFLAHWHVTNYAGSTVTMHHEAEQGFGSV
ncbi:hypothetical protein HW532_19095 [Kaustia mangrovi]|uniref:Uncharacterized protein n=1 Tax=Kaustia mangrovi TaxID=2593653 RepID=A0A7S8HDS6_9HYPH|nr:hypothetical protein [Kaustia mangrovi]QPC44623.1 hypothetical protein HW532_19095 [Kaustia mangrovi]